jgi:hypothetical protein
MPKAAKKKAAPKKRAAKYEDIVQLFLSLDELIAMSVGNKTHEKKQVKEKAGQEKQAEGITHKVVSIKS